MVRRLAMSGDLTACTNQQPVVRRRNENDKLLKFDKAEKVLHEVIVLFASAKDGDEVPLALCHAHECIFLAAVLHKHSERVIIALVFQTLTMLLNEHQIEYSATHREAHGRCSLTDI